MRPRTNLISREPLSALAIPQIIVTRLLKVNHNQHREHHNPEQRETQEEQHDVYQRKQARSVLSQGVSQIHENLTQLTDHGDVRLHCHIISSKERHAIAQP